MINQCEKAYHDDKMVFVECVMTRQCYLFLIMNTKAIQSIQTSCTQIMIYH